MHEVSLVADLVAEAQRQAAGRTVAAGPRPLCLQHPRGDPAAGIRDAHRGVARWLAPTLEAEPFDVLLDCHCGFSGALGHDDLISSSIAVCPACGAVSNRPRTAELELLEVRRTL